MFAPLPGIVRTPRNHHQRDRADQERKRIQNCRVQAAELFDSLGRAWQPEKQTHLPTDETEVKCSENNHLLVPERPPVSALLAQLKLRGFCAKRLRQSLTLTDGQPHGLCGMILN